ncbi:Hypothetical Protein U712_01800 [Bacillus subtilis PY79]|nr:Hypothetical Protein U712_01800 [Bacillus subtilis PY79]AKN12426.1 hypothetical protein ABU16_1350 [Bacillus subtilis]KZD81383.1 hypothetical protein B4417_2029 [Bacillus subtilis]
MGEKFHAGCRKIPVYLQQYFLRDAAIISTKHYLQKNKNF